MSYDTWFRAILCGIGLYVYGHIAWIALDAHKWGNDMDAMVECIDKFVASHKECEKKAFRPEIVTEYKSWIA